MNRDVILENKLYKCFDVLLREEKSINDEVYNKSTELSREIREYIKNPDIESREYVNDDIFKLKYGFKNELWGKKITISVVYTHFKDINCFNEYKSNIEYSDAQTNFVGRNNIFLFIKCYGISGDIKYQDLCDSVQHELNHIYQDIRGSKTINNFSINLLYNKAISRLNNKDEFIDKCAWLIYFSYDFEQDGYLNGMYAYFMSNEEKIPNWDEIREMSIYKCIKTIRDNLIWLKKCKVTNEHREMLKEEFNISFDWLLKFGERGLRRIVRKMSNVLEKIKKDKNVKTLGYGLHPFIY